MAFEESESGERSSNGEMDALLLIFEDKMSTADELPWVEGDPIDKRSKRTSVPLFDAWTVPTNSIKVRHVMKLSNFTHFFKKTSNNHKASFH